jgi:hypothetical protein
LKLLRNPIVTGLLVLAALGMVVYQIYAPRWERSRAIVPQPVAAAVAAVAHVLAPPPALAIPHPAENPALAELVPEASIDRDFAKTHFDAWVESPSRDPFLLLGVQPVDPQELGLDTNSPIRKLKYKGMLDQTGGRVAVIDHDVYQRGDEIKGYKIIEISSDEVWFQGPRAKERLGREQLPSLTNFFPRSATAPVRQP